MRCCQLFALLEKTVYRDSLDLHHVRVIPDGNDSLIAEADVFDVVDDAAGREVSFLGSLVKIIGDG